MEWTTVTAIVVLAGLCATLIKPIVSLTRVVTRLETSMERNNEKLDELSGRNSKAHDKLFDGQREHDKRLDNHEQRIIMIEAKDA